MADLKLYNGTEAEIENHGTDEGAIYASTDTNVIRYDLDGEGHYIGQEIFVGEFEDSEETFIPPAGVLPTTNMIVSPATSDGDKWIPFINNDITSNHDTWSSAKISQELYKISQQLEELKNMMQVQISGTQPTNDNVVLWIQP